MSTSFQTAERLNGAHRPASGLERIPEDSCVPSSIEAGRHPRLLGASGQLEAVPTFWDSLRLALDRRMVHWTLAYLAAAWLALQMTDVLTEIWNWPVPVQRGICVGLALGLLPALVLSWFHGERGSQRVTCAEVLLVGALLFASGAGVWAVVAP